MAWLVETRKNMPEIWQKYSRFGKRIVGHVSTSKGEYTEWRPVFGTMNLVDEDYSNQRPMPREYKIYADCCCCKMPADQLVFRTFIDANPYYGSRNEFECADGYGCKANPRRKIGKRMRENWREVYEYA